MDFVKNLAGGSSDNAQKQDPTTATGEKKEGGGLFGGLGDKLNSAAGGGRESEKNEDYLDKGMSFSPSSASC